MSAYFISYFITILFWIWIIRKYDKFEREPLLTVMYVVILGGLISSQLAGIFNHLFSKIINYSIDPGSSIDVGKPFLLYSFVGINEECLKAFTTVFLIHKLKSFNEPADALVYGMTVAFGFSVFENINYTLKFGLANFYVRQFNAVPLHIGLAAVWGIGIAKARFLNKDKYLISMLPYILIAALIHIIYNLSPDIISYTIVKIGLPTVIAFGVIRFAVYKLKRFSEDGPFSNRLFCRHCHTPNLPGNKVCRNCGKEFQLGFYRICQECGNKIDLHAAECPYCKGNILNPAETNVN